MAKTKPAAKAAPVRREAAEAAEAAAAADGAADGAATAAASADGAASAADVAAAAAAATADEADERLASAAQRPAAALPAGEAVYSVISPLEHDLVRYAPGDDITLTDAQADRLLGHTVQAKGGAAEQNAPEEEA